MVDNKVAGIIAAILILGGGTIYVIDDNKVCDPIREIEMVGYDCRGIGNIHLYKDVFYEENQSIGKELIDTISGETDMTCWNESYKIVDCIATGVILNP